MSILSRVVQALVVVAAVHGSPLERRGTVPSNQIVGLPEAVPNNVTGELYKAYQPFLQVQGGCVPFPAVDANGNTNEGLKETGSPSSGCSGSTGQVYARGFQAANGRYAIMYSWYMPKDSPSTGLGHRHDWEGAIIWLASSTAKAAGNILAVCPSAHGDWKCDTKFSLSGTGAQLAYSSTWPVNHALSLTSTKGGQQPLVAWESMSDVVKAALQTTNFGSANVPFKDSTLAANMEKAKF
ncbi:hypothetical protein PZA11_005585 [Diplocarpon coronariae]|uniref:NPP1 domain protein n=1 Tax=Diplocarpon coronariae TaxID=2795749 RepID=A0A218Z6J2_9HELO|nr:hypothetical protein B2J93_7089 [Marssonina coronariae]